MANNAQSRYQASSSAAQESPSTTDLLGNLLGVAYRCLNDRYWSMQFVSDGVSLVTGYPPAAFTHNSAVSFSSIIVPADRAAVAVEVNNAIEQHRPYQISYRIRTSSDEVKWVWEQGRAIRDAKGHVTALEGYIADITKVKIADALMTERAALLDQARDAIFVIDAQQRISFWNGGAERLFGWSAAEATGELAVDLIEWSAGSLECAASQTLRAGLWSGEIVHRDKDGVQVDTEGHWSLIAADPASGRAAKMLVICTDIGERKKKAEKIFRLAFFDALTDLPNRTSLLDTLHRHLLSSSRNHAIGALMFCDLDHFKLLNDTKGHAAGDALLQAVARRLQKSVRETDVVARLGGDEFVVVLNPDYRSYDEAAHCAESVAENIFRNMAPPVLLAGESYTMSLSIGITLFSGQVDTVENAMMKADSAMYLAKSAGRNAWRFFDPLMQASISAQQHLERDLQRAIQNGEFVLHYQPQVDQAGRTVGAEALLRWRRPDGALMLPAQFLKAAEVSGQIRELGRWVLQTACAQLAQWADNVDTRGLSMSVNVSTHQFIEPDFLSTINAIFISTRVDPRKLKLELTESVVFGHTAAALETMRQLRKSGVGFALDDFGTGYSSLAFLRQLPLDEIKIDHSFMRDVLNNDADAAIVRVIVALSVHLGMHVVAEGVETRAQQEFLAQAGCYCYQGFFYKCALPHEQFLRFVRSTSDALMQ